MVEQASLKKYKTSIKYSKHVSRESKNAVKTALSSIQQRVNNNRQFFDKLQINVCENASDIKRGQSSLGEYLRDINIFKRIRTQGITVNPLLNNDKKEIIIRTGNRWVFDWKETFSPDKIKGILYHELGHQFDYAFFDIDPELAEKVKKLPYDRDLTDEEYELLQKMERQSGLSDTKEFKEAWKKDVTLMGSTLDKKDIKAFGYFSPNNKSDINISDGVDDKEVEEADSERSEIFAQLFAYAFDADTETQIDKQRIEAAYKNCFESVKSFITKYFGIKFPNTKAATVE